MGVLLGRIDFYDVLAGSMAYALSQTCSQIAADEDLSPLFLKTIPNHDLDSDDSNHLEMINGCYLAGKRNRRCSKFFIILLECGYQLNV